jgi:hypothetical protein
MNKKHDKSVEKPPVLATHDHAYKKLFIHREMVRDLLAGFLDTPWLARLDFTTLEKVSSEFITDLLEERRGDNLWRIRIKGNGQWLYLLILIEFQSGSEHFMVVRMGAYGFLAYLDRIEGGHHSNQEMLPPLLPIVLYNGVPSWKAPQTFSELLSPMPEELATLQPEMHYLLVDVWRLLPEQVEQKGNLVGMLIRLERAETLTETLAALNELMLLLDASKMVDIKRAFAAWMSMVLLPRRIPEKKWFPSTDLEEVKVMLAQSEPNWGQAFREKGRLEGRMEGRLEGRMEGRLEGILLQLQEKFGYSLPNWVSKKLSSADEQTINQWFVRILKANTLDDVFGS